MRVRSRKMLVRLLWAGVTISMMVAGTGLALRGLDRLRHPPPGQLVDIGGYRLHLHCEGSGPRTVILDAGMGDGALHWSLVQPDIAHVARVCSYDRAGIGWSDRGPNPRRSSQLVHELRRLLEQAAEPGPYILVGHSFGAWTAQLFAARYPDDVAGLILVDAADPEWWASAAGRSAARANAAERRRQAWPARFGLVRFYGMLINHGLAAGPLAAEGFLSSMPPDVRVLQMSLWSRPVYYETVSEQWQSMSESAGEVLEAGALGDVPLVVVTAEDNNTPEQAQLTRLSSRARQLIASESGHDVHIERPETVGRAILALLRL